MKKQTKNKEEVELIVLTKLKFPGYLDSHTNQKKLRKYIASEDKLSKIDKSNLTNFFMIGKQKYINKKNLSWEQAKRRLPTLDPYKDSDKDGVINLLDKRPFSKKNSLQTIKRRYKE